jgi:hypothetical protein
MRWPLALIFLSSCTGTLAAGGDAGRRPDAGSALDGGSVTRNDGGDQNDGGSVTGFDAGSVTRFDAGPCGDSLEPAVVPISGATSPGRNLHAAATPSGGAVIAYASGGVRVVRVDGSGATVGEQTIAGNEVWGVATSGTTDAVLVDRGTDELFVVGVGATPFETRMLGGVPHDVAENEWFGDLLRAGRLDWTGSEWVAYATVQRLWGSDGIAHYGDTLRRFQANGAPASTVWGWGCSHSIEVGLTHNASGLGPACISDCYPDKGVFFHHQTQLFSDPSGDCLGRIATRMGGIAADANGFLVAFASPEGRSSMDVAVVRVANDRSFGAIVWLTSDGADDGDARVAPYGAGFLVGYRSAAGDVLQRTDANGNALGAPVPFTGAPLAGSSDFFVHDTGDVGWVARTGSGLALARVRACF